MSWKEVEIGNLVELRQGLCINKKSNHLVAETGLPLLRITDMINNKHSVFIKEEVPERYITKYEDIIYSRIPRIKVKGTDWIGFLGNKVKLDLWRGVINEDSSPTYNESNGQITAPTLPRYLGNFEISKPKIYSVYYNIFL